MRNYIQNIFFTLFIMLLISVGVTNNLYSQDKLTIVSSASMFSDMAANLITDDFEIKTIVPIGGDPHKYRAKPSDARMVQTADLILINGLTFEGWIRQLIENSGTKGKVITITDGIEPISSLQYENSSDPHAWMNVSFANQYIDNIYQALLELKPGKAEMLTKNYESYKKELTDLDVKIQTEINKIPEKQRVLITSHDAFQYYGQRYGLRLEAIMGISTEAEAQTSDIMRVSKAIKENNVPAIFIESTINPKMLKQIAKDNKVAIGGELYADSLGDENSEGATYKKMMWHNTKTIVEALSKTPSTKTEEVKTENKVPDLTEGLSNPVKIIIGIVMLLTILMVIVSKIKRS